MRCIRCKASEGGVRMCPDCRRELREEKRDPSEVAQLFEEGSGRLRLGDFSSSVRVFQKLLRRDSRNLGAYESLIMAQGFLGRFDRALAALSAMHGVTPPSVPVVQDQKVPVRRGRRSAAAVPPSPEETSESPVVEVSLVSLGLFFRQL